MTDATKPPLFGTMVPETQDPENEAAVTSIFGSAVASGLAGAHWLNVGPHVAEMVPPNRAGIRAKRGTKFPNGP